MFTYIKAALLFSFLAFSSIAYAQPASTDDIIAIGTLKIEESTTGERKIVLHDEVKGNLDLVLTATLIDAIDESPADSFEVEGYMSQGDFIVKSLRPIE